MQEVRELISQDTRELFFAYDRNLELKAEEKPVDAPDGLKRTHFRIQGTHDQVIPGVLLTPGGPGPFPLVVMQHGASSEKGAEYITRPAEFWAASEGWAVLAIDAPHHGERTDRPFQRQELFRMPFFWRDHAVQTAQDLMRALDYAASRPEIDHSRTAYIGFSMGTILGVAFVAQDQRVGSAVFTIGGSVTSTRLEQFSGATGRQIEQVSELVDPGTWAPMISPRPVLMINGLRDDLVTPEAGRRLFAALNEPKRIEWYDGDHYGMRGSEFKLMRDFLRQNL